VLFLVVCAYNLLLFPTSCMEEEAEIPKVDVALSGKESSESTDSPTADISDAATRFTSVAAIFQDDMDSKVGYASFCVLLITSSLFMAVVVLSAFACCETTRFTVTGFVATLLCWKHWDLWGAQI
jgi:hypothetical protein